MMHRFTLLLALPWISLGHSWLPFDQSLPCLTSPVVSVKAGDTLEFQYAKNPIHYSYAYLFKQTV